MNYNSSDMSITSGLGKGVDFGACDVAKRWRYYSKRKG
jgi:hypothetical protein